MQKVNLPYKKDINRVYEPNIIKNDNNINELLNEFGNSEYDTIKNILNSNKILNFKDDKGMTLIHAIINNPSTNITEEQKIEIIKELIIKNVSLNSINEFNQNALHLASQKGYLKIIEFLINSKCDTNLIDNNGNAPIHYLVDSYIQQCKENDFYKESNYEKKITNTSTVKKINEIIDKKIYLEIDTILRTDKIFTDNYLKQLKNIVNNYKFNISTEITNLIDNKKTDVENVFKNLTETNKIEQIKAILLNSKKDLESLYEFVNYEENYEENFIEELKLKIEKQKEEIIKNINEKFSNINKNLSDADKNLKSLNAYYTRIVNLTYFIFYFYSLFELNNVNTTVNNIYINFDKNPNKFTIYSNKIQFKCEYTDEKNKTQHINNLNSSKLLQEELKKYYNTHHYFIYSNKFEYKKMDDFPFYKNENVNVEINIFDDSKILNKNKENIKDEDKISKFGIVYPELSNNTIFLTSKLQSKKELDFFNISFKQENFINEVIITVSMNGLRNKYSPISILYTSILNNIKEIKNNILPITVNINNYIINFNLKNNFELSNLLIKNINNLFLIEQYIKDIDIRELDKK